MSALNHLADMVADEFRVRANGNSLVLKEEGQEDYTIQVNTQHFAMSLDRRPVRGGLDAALPFLRTDQPGLTCKCDLIVFVPKGAGETLVLLMELKSFNSGDYLKQLRSSKAFAAYLAELGKVHGYDLGRITYRGVLIRARRIPVKGSTRLPRVSFTMRNGLEVCEWDRSYPIAIHQLLQAA